MNYFGCLKKMLLILELSAKKLNLDITYVGNNQILFDNITDEIIGNKINRNVEKEELINNFYGKHHILLHLSKFESGQPCLAIMEALSCGLPVVATRMDNYEIPGIEFTDERNVDIISNKVLKIINDYDTYRIKSLKSAYDNSWGNIIKEILIHYNFYLNNINYKKSFNKIVINNDHSIEKISIYMDDGLLKININEKDNHNYNIKFKDKNLNILYENDIVNNMWSGIPIIDLVHIEIKKDDYSYPFYYLFKK